MSYQVRITEAAAIVELDGDFYQRQSDDLDRMLAELAAAGRRQVIISFKDVGLLGSTTLTVLVRHSRAFAARGGQLVLCGLAGSVERVMNITNLVKVFTVYASEQAALAALAAKVPA